MNLSLRRRVMMSFVTASVIVIVLSSLIFYFLDQLNREIESITVQSNRANLLTDEIWISTTSVLNYERKILSKDITPSLIEDFMNLCDGFASQLQSLESLYNDVEIKKVLTLMQSNVESLKVVLSKASFYSRDNIGATTVSDLSKKILQLFSEFQDRRYSQSVERDKQVPRIIKKTKKVMMIVLFIGFMVTIILGLVVPGKIALPFKKIKDAIRELQECNFDVSIYYNQDDEIGEIAREMNKMIHSFKIFEELRTDRVSLENRKFDALANLVKKPILVANAEGKLVYMNNQLYSILQVQSEDVIGKDMSDMILSKSIVENYLLAIKRRSKIENAEISIPSRVSNPDNVFADDTHITEEGEKVISGEKEVVVGESLFEGYANVIPVRGKDSSLDYYLMVLSTQVFS